MFDLAIIGGGPAGYTAAERAAHNGLNVVIFEKKAFGGVCLKIVSRKNKIVRKLNAGIRAKMTNCGATMVVGEAEIKQHTDEKVVILANEQEFEAKKLLLCCGSEVSIPPIKGLQTTEYITSREALELKAVPQSIVIVGGGVIGMEFAGLFNTLGSKVSVIEMATEILPPVDSEIAAMLHAEYKKQGIDFFVGAKVTELQNNKVLFTDNQGNEQSIDTEKILLCVGRKPSLKGIEILDLEPFRNGIKVNDKMQTSKTNVYAAGDITAFSMLAHTAVREAEVAVNNIVGKSDTMAYNAVPAVVYTNPEVAGVGLTEDELKAQGRSYSVRKLPMTFSGRFVAENEGGNGLCKLIFDDRNTIVGCHMIGNPSSEIIAVAALAIEQQLTAERFEKLIFPHPSVGEIIKETLFA